MSQYIQDSIEGPGSWVFYAVARIRGQYRPLAIIQRQAVLGDGGYGTPGVSVLASSLCAIDIFSDPANRAALDGEVSLAHQFYGNPDRKGALPVYTLPIMTPSYWMNESKNGSESCEFPFISICLLLGASYQLDHSWRRMPLGTVFRDVDHGTYGTVIIDITDLDNVRYGIIAFARYSLLEILGPGSNGVYQSPGGIKEELEAERLRKPLSCAEYVAKFGYEGCDSEAKAFESVAVVDEMAMDPIWPSSTDAESIFPSQSAPRKNIRSLAQQAASTLIQSTQKFDRFDMSIFDSVEIIPAFRGELKQGFREDQLRLGQTQSTGQLLSLAFEGDEHLRLETFQNLSIKTVDAALGSERLSSVSSISLCIDGIQDTAAQVVEVLSRHSRLERLYLFHNPARLDDSRSIELFAELSKHPALLRQCDKIHFAGAYSASLNKLPFLPTENGGLPVDVYPVQSMFEHRNFSFSGSTTSTSQYPMSYFLGDALLRPEAFAASFLSWIRHRDSVSFTFARGAPTLQDLSRSEICPIPSEIYSTSGQPAASQHITPLGSSTASVSKVRVLERGAWTVLVSTDEADFPWRPSRRILTKYAFVRAKVPIVFDDPEVTFGPDEVEVGGLKEFLQATAPGVDLELVDKHLVELSDFLGTISGKTQQGQSNGPYLRTLTDPEAYALLQDCSKRVVLVNNHLRNVMKKPRGNIPQRPIL